MDLEVLKDYFESIEKELEIDGFASLELYKAMLKHKYILDEAVAKLIVLNLCSGVDVNLEIAKIMRTGP